MTLESGLAETVDVMCAAEADDQVRQASIAAACEAWSLLPSQGEALDQFVKPTMYISTNDVKIGRACISRRTNRRRRECGLAPTGESLRLLERIARCVEMEEPVLLSGESGTGKTATVQELARLCGMNLTVLNMSQQSDVSDLMGEAFFVALTRRETEDLLGIPWS